MTLAREEMPRAIDVAVHVVEPGTPGSGVYDVTQPDYLLLNNPCGQLTLYPFETESYQPCYGVESVRLGNCEGLPVGRRAVCGRSLG